MTKVELFVGLKVPDTTALTAKQTMHRMGYKNVKKVVRETYYRFTIEGDAKAFEKKISKVDILVNANKNTARFSAQEEKGVVAVLVKDSGGEGLLSTLNDRLGLSEIVSVEKGVYWALSIDGSKKDAEAIGKELLSNKHFQDVEIFN